MKRWINIAAVLATCFIIALIILPMRNSHQVSHKIYEDEFYTNRGSWDEERLPIRKPYSLVGMSAGWLLLNCSSTEILIAPIRDIEVVADYLIGRVVPSEPAWTPLGTQCWFMFDLSQTNRTEALQPTDSEIFSSFEAFSNSCLQAGITDIPQFKPVKTFFIEYVENGRCHWFPTTEKLGDVRTTGGTIRR